MAAPQDEEPGFETDVNELPDSNNGPEDSLEDKRSPDAQKTQTIVRRPRKKV